ncbi:hypothetical protein MTR67_010754 [Solanum verrucosum]|uniref:Uncharacterized protein n=1 Tax=Solanum verrucosum TaxID=315347 RepID=A0AAF0Q5K3_SOLVR|nr:hypothetical protein MTR67_010754 [Solanum verrucosum]
MTHETVSEQNRAIGLQQGEGDRRKRKVKTRCYRKSIDFSFASSLLWIFLMRLLYYTPYTYCCSFNMITDLY